MSDENKIETSGSDNSVNQVITFDRFLELLKSAITLEESKSTSQAFQLVKKGFSGESRSDQNDDAFNLLKNWQSVDLFTLKLVTEGQFGTLNSFAKQLSNRLRFHFIQELSYPLASASSSIPPKEIVEWIRNSGKSAPLEKVQQSDSDDLPKENPISNCSSDKLLRMKFVCLFKELKDPFLFEAIDVLLTDHLICTGRKFSPSRNSYLKFVSNLLTSKITPIKIEGLQIASAPFKEIAIESREREGDLWKKNQELQIKVTQLETNEIALENQFKQRTNELEATTNLLEAKKQALEEWKDEHKALENHWQEVSRQNLTKQGNEIKKRLKHELGEIRLCLESTPADIDTTVFLLNRIDEILGEKT